MLRKILLIALAAPLFADDFSFTGNFTSDDNAAYFVFTLGSSSSVTLRTLGYAGGVNAVGTTIGRGGFDPILSLFAGTGPNALLIGLNNDGTCGDVGQDSVTSACWDSYLSMPGLVAGTYTVVLTQSDNSPFVLPSSGSAMWVRQLRRVRTTPWRPGRADARRWLPVRSSGRTDRPPARSPSRRSRGRSP